MAYAPYHNGELNGRAPIIGAFNEKDNGHRFEFSVRGGSHDIVPDIWTEFPHMVFVGPYGQEEIRYARVLKTVAHVVIGEEDDGTPVVQKWAIKNHIEYREAA